MQSFLDNSLSLSAAGIAPGKKVFDVKSGPYSGRKAILILKKPGQTSEVAIKLYYSDNPYAEWTHIDNLIVDCDDYPFDATIDNSGNIYVVYTKITSHDLMFIKLTFSGGIWLTGTPVTIYNVDPGYYPSIIMLPSGRIQVSWSRYSSGSYSINTKYSDDNGSTWGSGPTDAGTALTSGVSSAYSKLSIYRYYLYAIYGQGGDRLSYRHKESDSGEWSSESDIASGTGFDSDFDVAVSSDGRLAVVYDDGQLRYREFDGSQWSGVILLEANGGIFPQIIFSNNNPYIVYLSVYGEDQNRPMYIYRDRQSFTDPAPLDVSMSPFEKVLCYNIAAATYNDRTTAAANDTEGDIYHAASNAVFKEIGDALYIGLSKKFHYLKIILSTAGAGGEVNWQYYNGADWAGFTPSGGNYHFSSLDKGILLWNDLDSVPADWQKYNVSGGIFFWIRVVVTSAYSTAPVGTQITSISDAEAIVLME